MINDEWRIICNTFEHPLEFDDEYEANELISSELKAVRNEMNPDGRMRVRSAPKDYNAKFDSCCGLDPERAETTFKRSFVYL